jgi:hypothetical protein
MYFLSSVECIFLYVSGMIEALHSVVPEVFAQQAREYKQHG